MKSNYAKVGLLLVLVLSMGACTTTRQHAATDFQPPKGDFQVIVMRPDVSAGVLTASGMTERREDWSVQANQNVLAALQAEQAKRGGSIKIAQTAQDIGTSDELVAKLNQLHNAVGLSIRIHKYMPGMALPTKSGVFDWTLGELAIDLGRASDFDYALFLHAEDSFSSGGRVALQAVGFLGCVVGVCYVPAGGQQVAFASLVDLQSGRVVWYNHLQSTVGDIRTPEGAAELVEKWLAT